MSPLDDAGRARRRWRRWRSGSGLTRPAFLVPGGAGQRALQGLELLEQMVSVAVALALFFLEQAEPGLFGGRVAVFADAARSGRRRGALHFQQAVAIPRSEGELTGQHLEEQHPECIQVGLRSGLFAARLLG